MKDDCLNSKVRSKLHSVLLNFIKKKTPDFELLFYNQASFKTDLAELFISENQNVHAKDDLEISYYD